ncbi:retrotransposon gag protein [Cucumis melo var. makuwa]|uniref:Retrotransposon gag protein n=1 Tax=Cucumis melo var. makuwa TaxID=1194695 RepID=A0A5A7VQ13_CUCMM|nr:retrotransposon gag protein [Cucumis melo var. makuwa]
MLRMDSRDSSKRETTEFHSKGVIIPSKACKRKHLPLKEGKQNKKMWKPKPIKGKDEDFLRPQSQRSITLIEFLPRSFLDDHLKEVLEVTVCHVISIAEVNNNYASSEEIDNSNEIKQRALSLIISSLQLLDL